MDTELDIRQVLGLLRRRFPLVLATVAVVTLLAGLVTFALTPTYTASSLVLVDTAQKNLLDPEQIQPGTSESARVDSEVRLVTADTNLLTVIRDLGLLTDPELGPKLDLRRRLLAFFRVDSGELPSGSQALGMVLDNLRKAVSADRVDLTYLISVEAKSASAERAADLANRVAQAYIRNQVAAKIDSTMQARDILQARLSQASSSLAETERAFSDFIEQNLETIAAQTGRTDLSALHRSLLETEERRQEQSQRLALIDQALPVQDWKTLADELQSEAVQALAEQRAQLEAQLAAAAPESEPAIDLRAELERIDAELQRSASEGVSRLRDEVTQAQSTASSLRGQMQSMVLQAELPPDLLTQVYEIQQEGNIARNQYQTMLSRIRDLEAQASLQIADSRVVSEALPPTRPAFPNTLQILSLASLGSLVLGLALAFLYENYIGGFVTEAQFATVLRLTSTSTIPQVRSGSGGALADLIVRQPLGVFAEGIRGVRIALDQARRRLNLVEERGTLILVSSAIPNEGKTTIAVSVARAYALSGANTLLIDADLRKPEVHTHLGRDPSRVLTDYLAPSEITGRLSDLVATDELTSLHVVLGERRHDLATDQLVSGKGFSELLRHALKSYQYVVLDTAPIVPVVDTLYLAECADVIVFVVRAGSTSQTEAARAANRLRAAAREGTEIIGVLNQDVAARVGGKYSGYYQAY